MRLKKIELHGFKSFPERVQLNFDVGITGIVGPNGSGKSNIADAVRWTLGEQSAKALRGGKMEDVIFGGTEKRRRLAFCEVSLLFDNADNALSTPYTDVEITRRVFRSGESEYLINQTPCRLKDIVDLFRDTGVGQDGYSLIGQGRVDEILSTKSDERRSAFEEAAGIAKYKSRRTDAQRRMKTTMDNAARINDILEQYRDRLPLLKEQSEAARRYLALREELKTLDLNAFVIKHDAAKKKIDQLGELTTSYAEAIKDSEAAERELSEKRDALMAEIERIEDATSASQRALFEAVNAKNAREGENNLLKERISTAQRETLLRQQETGDKTHENQERERAIEALNARITEERRALDELHRRLSGDEYALHAEESAALAFDEALEKDKATLIAQMNHMSDARSGHTRLITLRAALNDQLSAVNETGGDDSGDIEGNLANAERARDVQQAQINEIKAQLIQLEQAVKGHTARLEALRAEQNRDMVAQRESAARLQMLSDLQRDHEGYQQSVKRAMAYAEERGMSGVRGAVAELIKVPTALEIAVEMCLGAAMQNLVVDTERDAQILINYLREKQLGRATFLPINAIRGRQLTPNERRLLTMPGCLGALSELIECDVAHLGIIEHLMGRTVVAENLDCGIPIMRAGQRAFRLVTLKGDVMHSGGSMTGGSAQSRVSSLLSRKREIFDFEAKISALIGDIKSREREIVEGGAQLSEATRALTDAQNRLHQEEIGLTRESERLLAAKNALSARALAIEKREEEIARLTRDIADIDAQFNEAARAQDSAAQDHAALREAIVSGQKRLTEMRRSLEENRAALTRRKVEYASNEQRARAAENDARRLTNESQSAADAYARLHASIEQSQTALSRDSAALIEGETTLETLQSALEQAQNTAQTAENDRARLQDELSADMHALDSLRADMDAVTQRHHRAEMQLSRAEGELRQLQDRIFEDYELTYAGAFEHKIEDFAPEKCDKRIEALRGEIRTLGHVNVAALDEYREVLDKHNALEKQNDDLEKARGDLEKLIDGLSRKMEKRFTEQFDLLNRHFGITFTALFGGGQARLILMDEKNALECDIDIVAQPPGKKLQTLTLLSGGERALTAIAILFAMLKLKPTPFCVLDEIEAALDDTNIGNFADYLADYARETQFIVVTHRKGTMERCDNLYGVTMEEKGISKMVSVQLS